MGNESTKEGAAETDFRPFARAVAARFAAMSGRELYVAGDPAGLFDVYLDAFPAGTNPVFRARRLYDCQTCRRFVRGLGNLVAVEGGVVTTVWGGLDLPRPFKQVADAVDAAVRAAPVVAVFRTKERAYGQEHNRDRATGECYHHFHGAVAGHHRAPDPEARRGALATTFAVAKRGLTEIREADLETVLGLIDANELYRGAESRPAVAGFLALLRGYRAAGGADLYVWEHLDCPYAAFRNTAVGTLLTDLAEGVGVDRAVRAFETKVAPANYKRPTAVITQGMVERAVETLTALGLHGALARRYARLADVAVTDVLFVDNDTKGKMKGGIAALLEDSVKRPTIDPAKAAPVTADEFLATALPGAVAVDVLIENRHAGNFVSLTGADGPERLFKWDNNFAWSYDGDTADSVRQRVKAAGGNVDAKLRVSLSWFNFDDLDLHAQTPDGCHVYYGNKAGVLDVDMNAGRGVTRAAVENLAFTRLVDGVYTIVVNQFARRETVDVGFAIEVEFGGVVSQFGYGRALKTGESVTCFRLRVEGGVLRGIETDLQGGAVSQEKWGVKTETLVPVAAVMFSPNHWGANRVGARHLIFALKGCRNPGAARGVYNEFLRADLEAHRKVFEVLGDKTKCAHAGEQISGVGFTAARGDSVVACVTAAGGRQRAYRVTF